MLKIVEIDKQLLKENTDLKIIINIKHNTINIIFLSIDFRIFLFVIPNSLFETLNIFIKRKIKKPTHDKI